MFWSLSQQAWLLLVFWHALLASSGANGDHIEQVQVHGLSSNHTLNSTFEPDLASNDVLESFNFVAATHELQERQYPPSNLIIADPARPPTFIYYCGIMTQICANIADALSNAHGLDGAYTTTLGYAPATKGVDKRRRRACSTFAPKCQSYYACDTRYPEPTYWRTTCDEFPFAIAAEGGANARKRCASGFEQSKQGAANGLIGLYAADLVNGQTIQWNQNSDNLAFTSPFTFILSTGTPLGARSTLLAEIRVTPTGDGAVFTATRGALPAPQPTSHLTNFDTHIFKVKNAQYQCVCPSSAQGCQNCFSTRRPPFGPGPPPDGTGGPLRRQAGPTTLPEPHVALPPTRTINPKEKAKRKPLASESSPYWSTLLPRWLRFRLSSSEARLPTQVGKEAHTPGHGSRPKIASILAELRSQRQISPLLLPRQEQNTCPNDKPTPDEVAQDMSDDAYTSADEASAEADALAANDAQKQKAEKAAQEAEEAADQAAAYLGGFVGADVVSGAVSGALAAAAALVLGSAAIDSIYDQVTDAAHSASAILSLVSASSSAFSNICARGTCPVTTSISTLPTSGNAPTSTTSTTSMRPPATPTGANGCFGDYAKRTWGLRIAQTRASFTCYDDFTVQVEPISGSRRFRLSSVVNGTTGYLSWTSQAQTCGEVNFIQLVPTSYDTALTMEWAVDTCASDGSARIVPYWNGSPFPNFVVDLIALLAIGSPSQAQLTCYENSLSIQRQHDQYFTILAANAQDPVAMCSDKYPYSSTNAVAKEQATVQANATDDLLAKASLWPTALFKTATRTPTATPTSLATT